MRESYINLENRTAMPWLTCRDVSEMTTDYLDRALPLSRRLGMRFHLAICSYCRRHIEQVHATVTLLRKLPPVRLSQKQEDALIDQILYAPISDSTAEP
ncbi:MAG: zf-HC2 domain-containing protein [Acetobacteraceae bacterium]|nr:zf-HC2 domain-containing protein [Acetobacteraceae bacterium]